MTKVILKTYPDNPRVLKAQVTAKYCDVEVDIQSCNMKEGEHKSEAFLKVNPFHQGTFLYILSLILASSPFSLLPLSFHPLSFSPLLYLFLVPTAFTESGDNGVFESNSIARYIARLGASKKNLLGKDALEASRIDAFLDAGITYETWFGFWYYTHIKLYITEENTVSLCSILYLLSHLSINQYFCYFSSTGLKRGYILC
jgi:glutathione S-transferase